MNTIKKTCRSYLLRLSENEYSKLSVNSYKAGLTISDYLRKLINNQEVKTKPPDTYKDLVWEISKIGIDIKQIADKAKTVESISEKDIEATVFLMSQIIELMREKG